MTRKKIWKKIAHSQRTMCLTSQQERSLTDWDIVEMVNFKGISVVGFMTKHLI